MPTTPTTQVCRTCDEEKPVEAFNANGRRASGRDTRCAECSARLRREHRAAHPEIHRAAAARWKAANPERARANARRTRARNRDSVNARKRAYYAANTEKVKAANRAYYEANLEERREYYRLKAARRNAIIREAAMVLPFTAAQLEARFSMFAGCWLCGGPKETIDHVKPLKAGGAHMLCNLRPACVSCNSRKRDLWPLSAVFERLRNR